jgi:hypothetical protein
MNRCPTFFIIDETASLKRFDRLLEAIGRMRGYGVSFWLHFQAFGQARLTYGEVWEVIPGLAGVVQYFGGTGDKATADKMSEYGGTNTIVIPGNSINIGDKPGGSNSSSLIPRLNFMPDEIMRYPLPQQVVQYMGVGMTEGRLIHPSMNDFPVYQVLQQMIEEDYTGEQAEAAARNYEARMTKTASRATPPGPQSRVQFRIPAFNPVDWLDGAVAKIMGHEKD